MLGLALVTSLFLASNFLFVWYALRTPGPQRSAFLWGYGNGIFGCFLAMKIPGFGPWFNGLMEYATNPPIDLPWLQDWMVQWGTVAFWAAIGWLFVTKFLGWSPSVGAGGAGKKSAGAGSGR